MQKDLISVIVPVYKSERYLHACVNSILRQTYTKLEIILVDDGSPDNSGDLCDMFAKKDRRIKVIHKSNGGVCSARNAALDVAQGEFVAFVDHDDVIEENMYEYMYNQVNESATDICICGINSSVNAVIRTIKIPHEKTYTPAEFLTVYLANYRYFAPFFIVWNKLIRNSLLQGEEGLCHVRPVRFREDILAGEDCCFVADCLVAATLSSAVISTIDIPLYNYTSGATHSSLYKTYTFEHFDKCSEHLRTIMMAILPQRKADINSALCFQENEYRVNKVHIAVLSGQKNIGYKLTHRTIILVLRSTARSDFKLSVLLLYLLPNFLYRLVFELYQKFMLRVKIR